MTGAPPGRATRSAGERSPEHPDPEEAVELLERALAYTRGVLCRVTERDLDRPTPCTRWDLDALLDHMDDSLDAFAEGAFGAVDTVDVWLPRPPGLGRRVGVLQAKACALLGAWSAPDRPAAVHVGGQPVDVGVVALAAALEITVHGWDVAATTRRGAPIPVALARRLLAPAVSLVDPADRGVRFGPPLLTTPRGADDERLLAHLGRDVRAVPVTTAPVGTGPVSTGGTSG